MPTYTINGRRFTSETALSDADLEELAASAGATPTPSQPAQPAQQQAPVGRMEQMFGLGSPIARFAKGAVVNPLLGINQMLAETGVFGEQVRQGARQQVQQYEQATKAARERVGSTGTDFVELAGAVASPTMALTAPRVAGPAAARISQALPGAATAPINQLAAQQVAARALPTTSLERIGTGAATGAAFAGMQPVENPVEYLDQKLEQMGTGALFGTLVSGGIETASKAKKIATELYKPLTKEGRLDILRKYFNDLSGGKKDEVIKALQSADEIVPGSRPTAAEAVSNIPQATGLAAFQQQVSRQAPETGAPGAFAARAAEQQAARAGLLQREVAQTPEMLDFARSLRDFDAARNYGEAFAQNITANPRLAQIASNPYIRDAIPDAIKLSEAKGISAKTDLTQFLQYVKTGLDKQLSRTGDTALSRAEKQAVQEAKNELVGWLSTKNPEFARAREAFAEASKPINRMEVGQFLQQKLNTPLDAERAGAFALAVQNAASTIKKASGAAVGEKLSDVLTPKQVAAVDNILADLQRTTRAQELAGRSTTGVSGMATTELPNLLNRYAAITNTVLRALKKDSVTEINKVASELLLEPQKLAAFMQGVPPGKANIVAEALLKRVSPELRDGLARALAVSREELAGGATRAAVQGMNQ